jgi:hypothetical protein
MAAPERRDERVQRPYAGIGSRKAPEGALRNMEALAGRLARRGWVLRSGASPGSDQAFYRGARGGGGRVELYLPWPGFEAYTWKEPDASELTLLDRPSDAACELAGRFHPDWDRLHGCQRRLLARDGHEVLGMELDSPANFVVCWTPDGTLDGSGSGADGTRQALRIAHHHGIPVFNLARPDHYAAHAQCVSGRLCNLVTCRGGSASSS